MKEHISYFFLTLLLATSSICYSQSRLKDLVSVKGVRNNPLIGYGLIIGLNGTGDSGGEITNSSLRRMFQKLGLNPSNEISSKNVAAVIVTSKLHPFARVGQKLDITVSSIGDASSLAGGTLLITPLKGGDGEIYAVASGAVSIGGLNQGSKFATTGLIPEEGIIEKELNLNFDKKKALRLSLIHPDFTNAHRIQQTINNNLGGKFAIAKDSTTIDLIVPNHYQRKVVELMALIENFKVVTDQKATIVINERTGTVVMGGEVRLKKAAISHGDLSVEVKAVEGNEGNEGDGSRESIFVLKQSSTLNELVKVLNALGVGPEDLIAIFEALKQNGSLIGEIKFI
jgi:flagellar P-ring protein FlgI